MKDMGVRYLQNKRAEARRRGLLGVEARRRKMAERAGGWEVVRVVSITDPRSGERHEWTISATDEPAAPVAIRIDGKWHRLASLRTLRGLMAKAIFGTCRNKLNRGLERTIERSCNSMRINSAL